MKKLFLTAAAVALASPLAANADVITDIVYQDVYVGSGGSHSYSHNINDDGFSLGTAVGGSLEILIYDDSNPDFYFFGNAIDLFEAVIFQVEEFDFDTGGFTLGTAFLGDLELEALGALNADGYLDVHVKSVLGDFYVGNSTLTVYTESVAVPEPGSLFLFGLGLLGIGFARRRSLG